MLTEEEAHKLKRQHARAGERYDERKKRERQLRVASIGASKKEKKAQRKQRGQHKTAADAARKAGKQPKPVRRSVFAIPGGAVETNRRKF